jgi:hypothetical protein
MDALDGSEGGCWVVRTEGATHRFDFDAMTVTRCPHPDSASTVNDQTRPIREIVTCTVGERGDWVMEPEGPETGFLEYYWHLSSRILSIAPSSTDCAEP